MPRESSAYRCRRSLSPQRTTLELLEVSGDGFDFRAAREAIAMSSLEPLQRLVLWQLVEHMPHCSPSITRLAQRTGCCERTVRACIAGLESAGWLRVSRRFGARSLYELTPAPHTAVSRSGAGPTAAGHASVQAKTPAPHTAVSRAPRQDMPDTPAPHTAEPRHHVPVKPEQADRTSRHIDGATGLTIYSRIPADYAIDDDLRQKAIMEGTRPEVLDPVLAHYRSQLLPRNTFDIGLFLLGKARHWRLGERPSSTKETGKRDTKGVRVWDE